VSSLIHRLFNDTLLIAYVYSIECDVKMFTKDELMRP